MEFCIGNLDSLPSRFHFFPPDIESDLFPVHKWSLHFNNPGRFRGVINAGFMLLQNFGRMLLETGGRMLKQGET